MVDQSIACTLAVVAWITVASRPRACACRKYLAVVLRLGEKKLLQACRTHCHGTTQRRIATMTACLLYGQGFVGQTKQRCKDTMLFFTQMNALKKAAAEATA